MREKFNPAGLKPEAEGADPKKSKHPMSDQAWAEGVRKRLEKEESLHPKQKKEKEPKNPADTTDPENPHEHEEHYEELEISREFPVPHSTEDAQDLEPSELEKETPAGLFSEEELDKAFKNSGEDQF